jgi:hypothetical protein
VGRQYPCDENKNLQSAMIQANAKCINNGKKLNETIGALNNILNVVVSEEIEIVDSNNQPSKRWFFTGKLTGQKQNSANGDQDSLGNTPSNNNRDQLTTGGMPLDNSGGNIAPPGNVTGGALRDDRKVDQFGNTIGGGGALRDDGSTTAGGGINSLNKGNGIAGGMADDGQTAEQSRTNFLANQQRAADTTPAPLPGGMPLMGDTTPAPLPGGMPLMSDTTPPPTPGAPPPNQPATSTQADAASPSSAANTNITNMEDELRIAQEKLRSLKRTNDKQLNPSTGYYDYSHVPAITSQQRLVDELKRQVAAARA